MDDTIWKQPIYRARNGTIMCKFFKKRDQAKSTSLKLYFSKFFLSSVKQKKFNIFTGKTPLAVTK